MDKGESNAVARVLQMLPNTRKQINGQVLRSLLTSQTPSLTSPSYLEFLLSLLPTADPSQQGVTPMDTTPAKATPKLSRPTKKASFSSSESDVYPHFLVIVHLIDSKRFPEAKQGAERLIERIDKLDRRSLDAFAARAYFYLAFACENLDAEARKSGQQSSNLVFTVCQFLNTRLRLATVRALPESQATLIYTLLRCYMLNGYYQTAEQFVAKVSFPEGANNNDLARYMFYQGRFKALQLDYTGAAGYFMQAMRKAPQDGAIGFKQATQKWLVVISLLQGEIPERSMFRQPIYRICLAPYLELTKAVRLGDTVIFNKVIEKYSAAFEADETMTLIVRLRQNVIKTALKQISSVYSKIFIKDIAKKLQMDVIETEYLVAKAILDNSIDAQITSDTKDGDRYMMSSETADVYRTTEPQNHFDTRIKYCLEIHNQAVKALRYPPNKKSDVESIEAQRERELQELELAKELAEDDEDVF
ncbi:hypothetical protein WR25_18986 [Diploscapter pachys]|uniref:PCI domain-containing protein n=1 Tax=Diploscapter pachys TaxID=2018661 RepID=A0A2A2M024_9BILA|nr:hypothetical protein WR25_18986 [Diploscapter pachys]